MYAGPPTSSISPDRPSSSFNLTSSTASPSSPRPILSSTFRRRAGVYGLGVGHDADLEVQRDLTVERDRHVVLADPVERLLQVDLAPIDLEALGGERGRDVAARHRSVQRFGFADAPRDFD